MKKHKLIFTRGLPASGKSTWAKQWAAEKPLERVRISLDDIREMFGKYWVPQREKLVEDSILDIVKEACAHEYDIVIDATNMNEKRNNKIIYRTYSLSTNSNYEVEYKDFFDTPLDECIERDKNRERQVGEDVIRDFYERYKHVIENNG